MIITIILAIYSFMLAAQLVYAVVVENAALSIFFSLQILLFVYLARVLI